jgi:hypothetical protein
MPYRFLIVISPPEKHQRLFALLKSEPVRREYRLGFDLTFSHSLCLRGVAWIRPAYALTKRGDVGATYPTLLARQWRLTKQSKHRFASLLHLPLIIAQAWKAVLGAILRKRIRRMGWIAAVKGIEGNILDFHEILKKSATKSIRAS